MEKKTESSNPVYTGEVVNNIFSLFKDGEYIGSLYAKDIEKIIRNGANK